VKLGIRDLKFSYPSVPVLNNVRLEVHPGQIVAIVGKNGAGKSTLIKCINRILEPQQGSIMVDNAEVSRMSRRQIARKMAYLPQRGRQRFPITVFDTVLMGRHPHIEFGSGPDDERQVARTLEMLGLEDIALRDFNELSGGQQQKVLIARAIAQQVDIFLLDEPTSNLDIRHQLEVMGLLGQLVHNRGISAIVTVHDLNIACRFVDRVIMLCEGTIFAAGTPEDVLTAENIRQVYEVEVRVEKHQGKPFIIPLRPMNPHKG